MAREMYFFFGHENPLSNWHIRNFTIKHVTFNSVEQAMMFCKARLFGDLEVADKILQAYHPSEHKRLGRQVKNFNQALWDSKCEYYVFTGALAKFSQNPDLAAFLLATGDKELVEASPYDKIWGVGLDQHSPAIRHKKLWPGLNKLGPILERVRDTLQPPLALNP